MLKQQKSSDSNLQIGDRRENARVPIRSVAYVELDNDNGGLILNVSEGGIGVQSAEMIVGERFSRIRFRLPKSEKWVESEGKLVWLGKTRKEAGIQFVNLGDEARQQIQTWIYSATFRPGIAVDQGHFKIVWESEESKSQLHEPPSRDSEISSMFPSEKVVPPKRRAGVDLHLNEHLNESANEASPLDLGIAPGPVKRVISSPDFQASHPTIPETAPEALAPSTAAPPHPGPSFSRRAYNYPSGTVLPKDPFASIAADDEVPPSEIPPVSAPPEFNGSRAPDSSDYVLREHYRGLGYQPQPFEEPSGKGWYFAAAMVVVVLLGVGAVLAIGPANVKTLLAQHLPSSILSSNPAPPPPYDSLQKSPAPVVPSSSPASPAEANDDVPFGSAAEGAIVNPGVSNPPPQSAPTKAGPTHSANEPAASPETPAERTRSGEALPNSEQAESGGDAAEITRRFQMEHSGGSVATPPMSSYQLQQQPNSSSSISQKPAPAFGNESTADAYPEPAPASSTMRSASTPAAPTPIPNNAPQPSATPSGTVAVSSHFYALRAEDPQTTLARQGLAIGQLISIRQPIYPVEAERARVEGTVQLRLTIDQTGKVEIVHAVSGPPMLVPAAIEAVRQWRYAATTVEGKAQESVDDVNIVFRLANSASSPR